MLCVVVDIGNTSTSVGLVQDGRISRVVRLASAGQKIRSVASALTKLLGQSKASSAVVSSVVPDLTMLWVKALRGTGVTRPLVVNSNLKLGVKLCYPKTWTLGPDRLANMSGAVARYRTPVLVMDIGTAVTLDVIDARGNFTGGVIAPGPAMMTDYLAERTALLPRIDFEGRCGSIGRSTREAMRIGAQKGYRGMIRGIVEAVRASPEMKSARLCVTGGHARTIMKGAGLPCRVDPLLTLRGLWRIHELNTDTV